MLWPAVMGDIVRHVRTDRSSAPDAIAARSDNGTLSGVRASLAARLAPLGVPMSEIACIASGADSGRLAPQVGLVGLRVALNWAFVSGPAVVVMPRRGSTQSRGLGRCGRDLGGCGVDRI